MNKKTALIFGASGGIGTAIVKQLLNDDFFVCCTCHTQENLEKLKKEVGNEHTSFYNINLTDDKSVNDCVLKVVSEHGQISAVVFSVSVTIENKPILRLTWEDYQKHLDLQLKGLFNIIQSLKDRIKSGEGIKFVILLSEAVLGRPPAGLSHYVSAKYALLGFAKSMAVEFAKYSCTVNMVSPGMTQTDLLSNFPPKLVEITAENNPLGRIASPEDVANVVAFLSNEKSDYINGAHITVNGGSAMI